MYDLGTIGAVVRLDDSPYVQTMNAMPGKTQIAMAKIQTIMTAALGGYGAYKLFKDAADAAMDFGAEISNIMSITEGLKVDSIKKELMSLDSVLGYSKDLAGGAYFALSSGVKGNEKEVAQFIATIAKLNKTVVGEMIPTTDAITTTMNAYNLTVKDAGQVSDWYFNIVKLGKATGQALAASLGNVVGTAAAAGVSLEELGAGIATLTTTMPTAQAITSLNQVINGFISPAKEAKDIAAQYGIELSATALKSKGLAGALADIKAKTGGSVEVLAKLFTSVEAVKGVLPLATTQAQMFQDNLKEFGNSNGAMLKGFEKQTADMKTTWKTAMVEMDKALINFGDAMAPAINATAALIKAVSAMVNSIDNNTLKITIAAVAFGVVTVATGTFLYKLLSLPSAIAASTASLATNTVGVNANATAWTRLAAAQHLAFNRSLGNVRGPNVMNFGASQLRSNVARTAGSAATIGLVGSEAANLKRLSDVSKAGTSAAGAITKTGIASTIARSTVAGLTTGMGLLAKAMTAMPLTAWAAAAGYGTYQVLQLNNEVDKLIIRHGELKKVQDALQDKSSGNIMDRLGALKKSGRISEDEERGVMNMDVGDLAQRGQVIQKIREYEKREVKKTEAEKAAITKTAQKKLSDDMVDIAKDRIKAIAALETRYMQEVESRRAEMLIKQGSLTAKQEQDIADQQLFRQQQLIRKLKEDYDKFLQAKAFAAAETVQKQINDEAEKLAKFAKEKKDAEERQKTAKTKINEILKGFTLQQGILNSGRDGSGKYTKAAMQKFLESVDDTTREQYEKRVGYAVGHSVNVSPSDVRQIQFAKLVEEQKKSRARLDAAEEKKKDLLTESLEQLKGLRNDLKTTGVSIDT